jgi:hypothetical protein
MMERKVLHELKWDEIRNERKVLYELKWDEGEKGLVLVEVG